MEIVFDFDRWNLADYKEFVNLQSQPNEELETELLVKAISRWSFSDKVSVDVFDDLEVTLYFAIIELLNAQVQEMINDTSNVQKDIDMSAWRMKEFKAYRRALRESDYETVLEMVTALGVNLPNDMSKVGVEGFFNVIKSVSKSIESSQKK